MTWKLGLASCFLPLVRRGGGVKKNMESMNILGDRMGGHYKDP